MNFVQIPNLPESDVALAAVSGTYPALIDALHTFGINTVTIRCSQKLSRPVNSHADMLMHHLGGNRVVITRGEAYLMEELQKYGFAVTCSNICVSDVYPNDVLLDAARIGTRLFAKVVELDSSIQLYCKEKQIGIFPVRQGYAKCSTVVVDENSIITEDPSIAEAARSVGVHVLVISPGGVKLEGYDYGFLGGASGLISKNKLAFAGNVETHPDYRKIKEFCRSKNVELISLIDGPLLDVGGILPLKIKTCDQGG